MRLGPNFWAHHVHNPSGKTANLTALLLLRLLLLLLLLMREMTFVLVRLGSSAVILQGGGQQ